MYTIQIVLSLAFLNLKFILQIFHIREYLLVSLFLKNMYYSVVCEKGNTHSTDSGKEDIQLSLCFFNLTLFYFKSLLS